MKSRRIPIGSDCRIESPEGTGTKKGWSRSCLVSPQTGIPSDFVGYRNSNINSIGIQSDSLTWVLECVVLLLLAYQYIIRKYERKKAASIYIQLITCHLLFDFLLLILHKRASTITIYFKNKNSKRVKFRWAQTVIIKNYNERTSK